MERFTHSGKWLLAAALTSGLWLSQSMCVPPVAQAQSRRPGLGLPPPDDNQKQREEERKRDDDRKADEQRKQDESRRQEAERRQQEQSRQEQQRRQQEQSQQEARRRQQEQDSQRSQQEQARQDQQRRQQEQAAQEQRRAEQERARRDAEQRQREQSQQEVQRRQQEQTEARRRAQEPRERLAAVENAAPSRRPSLFQTPPPTNTPRTTTTTPAPAPASPTRGNERTPAENPRPSVSNPNPRSIGLPNSGATTGSPSGAPPHVFSGGRRPYSGGSNAEYGRTLPQPGGVTPSGPTYSGRPVVIDRFGRREDLRPNVTTPQPPPNFRSPTVGTLPTAPAESTRPRPALGDQERPRSRGPSLYQGTVTPPRQGGDGRDRQANRPGDSQGSSDLWRNRFRGGDGRGGRHGSVLPVDRHRPFDHICDRRCGHTRHYEHRCDGSCRHRRYDYSSPYGPVFVPIYVPVPEPTIIYEPRTEVVIIPRAPEPEAPPAPRSPERAYSDRLAEPMPLEDVIADLEAAWEGGNLDLMMRHVSPGLPVEIYERGALLYKLDREQFGRRNLDAFRRYKTFEMRFGKPELLSETEAVATGTHVFRDDQDQERRVRVIYAFHKEGPAWRLAGVDFSRDEEENVAGPPEAEPVAEPAPATVIRDLSLLWSQKVHLGALLAQSQPLRVATLRCRVADDEATFDLDAMRGVVPNTIAWALYHRGEKAPVETGIADLGGMNASAWVKLQLLATADAEAVLAVEKGHSRAAALPLRWLASEHVLAVHETDPPVVKKPAATKKSTGAKRLKRPGGARVVHQPRVRPTSKT